MSPKEFCVHEKWTGFLKLLQNYIYIQHISGEDTNMVCDLHITSRRLTKESQGSHLDVPISSTPIMCRERRLVSEAYKSISTSGN